MRSQPWRTTWSSTRRACPFAHVRALMHLSRPSRTLAMWSEAPRWCPTGSCLRRTSGSCADTRASARCSAALTSTRRRTHPIRRTQASRRKLWTYTQHETPRQLRGRQRSRRPCAHALHSCSTSRSRARLLHQANRNHRHGRGRLLQRHHRCLSMAVKVWRRLRNRVDQRHTNPRNPHRRQSSLLLPRQQLRGRDPPPLLPRPPNLQQHHQHHHQQHLCDIRPHRPAKRPRAG
mmetsp:Transcript_37900/g.79647  ORF Transcript_37900/g.79647 Transcript_37900/m.79647 type:complete len:233 (-) Transcript_37900:490-1188(-)